MGTRGNPLGQTSGVQKIMIARFVAPCGHRFTSKRAAEQHEQWAKCWFLPVVRSCKSCVHMVRVRDDNGMPEPYNDGRVVNECRYPSDDLTWEDIPDANPKVNDVKRDCPAWQWKFAPKKAE